MPITMQDVEAALSETPEPVPSSYTDLDTLLYAVAIGMGKDPLDPKELEYVNETSGSRVVPTAATTLGRGGRGGRELLSKMNFRMLLHGEQRLTIHQPLPRAADLLISSRIKGVYDKGADKGAIVVNEAEAKLATGEPLYTLSATMFYRGDGGFGGSADGAPEPHRLPERAPDAVCELPQKVDQALVYALCGDRNPLHRDPDIAKAAGFDKPILHGLCSYGIACHGVLKEMLDYDETRIQSFDVRFSAPAYPGETQLVELWQDGNVISFRVRIKERDVVSINNGRCVING